MKSGGKKELTSFILCVRDLKAGFLRIIFSWAVSLVFVCGLSAQQIQEPRPTVEKVESELRTLNTQLSALEIRRNSLVASGKYPPESLNLIDLNKRELVSKIEALERIKISLLAALPKEDGLQPVKASSQSDADLGNEGPVIVLKRADFLLLPPEKQKKILELKSRYVIED